MITKDELKRLISRIEEDDDLFQRHTDLHHKAVQALFNLLDELEVKDG
jgi:hypothetical protein